MSPGLLRSDAGTGGHLGGPHGVRDLHRTVVLLFHAALLGGLSHLAGLWQSLGKSG